MSVSPTSSSDSVDLGSPSSTPPRTPGSVSPRFGQYWFDSDLMLQSSDNVIFKVHRARLSGCGVFRDMFDIASADEQGDAAPTVALSESSRTLENVLPLFYDELPELDNMGFDEVLEALEASLKYNMTLVEHLYTARLRRMMPKQINAEQAFRLWARCTELDKPDLAAQALRLTNKGDILQFSSDELGCIDSRSLDRLWRTHHKAAQLEADALFKFAFQSARGECFYFQREAHSTFLRALLAARSRGLDSDAVEPLGFRSCSKCSTMAEELGLLSATS